MFSYKLPSKIKLFPGYKCARLARFSDGRGKHVSTKAHNVCLWAIIIPSNPAEKEESLFQIPFHYSVSTVSQPSSIFKKRIEKKKTVRHLIVSLLLLPSLSAPLLLEKQFKPLLFLSPSETKLYFF